MDSEEDMYSTIFLALKYPIRRRILRILNESAATYTQILNHLNVETGLLNYHLESLKGLITRDKSERYSLSDFGFAALTLLSNVETPVKRKYEGFKIRSFRVKPRYFWLLIITFLAISNIFWINISQNLSKDKTNTLGETIIQTIGFSDECLNILNSTVKESRIRFDSWDVMYRDTIEVSRLYRLVMSLDTVHAQQWSQIKASVDDLVDFAKELLQRYSRNETYMTISEQQSKCIYKIVDLLRKIELKAFPTKIVIGSNPMLNLVDEDITDAMRVSMELQTELKTALRAFSILAT